jgi:hypothetical protein
VGQYFYLYYVIIIGSGISESSIYYLIDTNQKLHLWKIFPSPTAVAFGSACFVVLGTWSVVWLGEEISDQWDLWRERGEDWHR